MIKTRRRYALALVSSLVFVYFYGGVIPWAVFQILLVLPLLSLIHAAVVLARLRYFHAMDTHQALKGQKASGRWEIANEDWLFYPFVRVRFHPAYAESDDTLEVSLGPGESLRREFTVRFPYRGVYAVGFSGFEVRDMLGIFRLKSLPEQPLTVSVMPRVLTAGRLSPDSLDMRAVTEVAGTGDDTATLANIRPFVPGDTLRRVHWKLSAKYEELMVKEFSGIVRAGMDILVDLSPRDEAGILKVRYEDRLIETAVAVCKDVLAHGTGLTLTFAGDHVETLNAELTSEFEQIYQTLGLIPFRAGIPAQELMMWRLREGEVRAGMVVITSEVGVDLTDALMMARLQVGSVSLFRIYDDEEKGSEGENRLLASLEDHGVAIRRVGLAEHMQMEKDESGTEASRGAWHG